MALCNLCKTINFCDLPPAPLAQGWGIRTRRNPDGPAWHEYFSANGSRLKPGEFVAYHRSLEELGATKEQCNLCHVVATALERATVMIELMKPTFELFLSRPVESDSSPGFMVLSPAEEDPIYTCYVVAWFGFCVSDTSRLKAEFRGRTIHSDPMHLVVLERIQHWIQECHTSHSHIAQDSPVLPTRILDLDCDGAEIRLFETQGARGNYIALSHCWGICRQSILTRQNLASFLTGFTEAFLPRTFQDAILITRKLGLRFLWIDSLCILQDDPTDWARESERMASVYGQAFVTIVASRASDDSEGFLGPRPLRTYKTLPYYADNVQGQILAFEKDMDHETTPFSQIAMKNETLSDRAWTLQERCLSPRTLHFGTSQISFECDVLFATEDGTFNTSTLLFATSLYDDMVGPAYGFRRIVEEYSRRKLTREEDKLPALAGIAKHFAQTHQSITGRPKHYLAGLWDDSLVDDLSWYSTPSDPRRPRPQRYRGPSWSWASTDAPIIYFIPNKTRRHLIAVMDAQVTPRSAANLYGEVEAGWIQCRGHLDTVVRHSDGQLEADYFGNLFTSSKYLSYDVEEYQTVGTSKSAADEKKLFFLPILVVEKGHRQSVSFLLIVEMTIGDEFGCPQLGKERRCFRRVGGGLMSAPMGVMSTWEAQEAEEVFLF